MKSAGVFVDVDNLYFCVSKKFPGRKVNYESYLNLIKQNHSIYTAIAYGTQNEYEAKSFISCLHHYGYDTKYKQPKGIKNSIWDVGICTDVMRIIDKLDVVVLGSTSRELVHLVEYARSRGISVQILACGIPYELKEVCNVWSEIDKSLLIQPEDLNVVCANCGSQISDRDAAFQSPDGKVYCSIECMTQPDENTPEESMSQETQS